MNIETAMAFARGAQLDQLRAELGKSKVEEMRELMLRVKAEVDAKTLVLAATVLDTIKQRIDVLEAEKKADEALTKLQARADVLRMYAELVTPRPAPPPASPFAEFLKKIPGGEFVMNLAPSKKTLLGLLANPVPFPLFGLEKLAQIPFLSGWAKVQVAQIEIDETIQSYRQRGYVITFQSTPSDFSIVKTLVDSGKNPKAMLEDILKKADATIPVSVSAGDIADPTRVIEQITKDKAGAETARITERQRVAAKALAASLGLSAADSCEVKTGATTLEIPGAGRYIVTLPGETKLNSGGTAFELSVDQKKAVETLKAALATLKDSGVKKIEVVAEGQREGVTGMGTDAMTARLSPKLPAETLNEYVNLLKGTPVKTIEFTADGQPVEFENPGTRDVKLKVPFKGAGNLKARLADISKLNENEKIVTLRFSPFYGVQNALYTNGILELSSDTTVVNKLIIKWRSLPSRGWNPGDTISTDTWEKAVPAFPATPVPLPRPIPA